MFSFEERGNTKKFPLIFLHGFLGSKKDWKPVISNLENDFFCISVDLPGHGSSLISNRCSFESFTILFNKFIKSKKISHCALIGYSMGGRISHYIHNHCLKNQVCICLGSHLGLTEKNEIKRRKIWNSKIIDKLENSSFDDFLEFWYSQKIFYFFKKSKRYFDVLKDRKTNKVKNLKKSFLSFCILKQKILYPDPMTYFLVGQKDKKYLTYYKKIKCRYQIVNKASHAIHLENPYELSKIIKEILHDKY